MRAVCVVLCAVVVDCSGAFGVAGGNGSDGAGIIAAPLATNW